MAASGIKKKIGIASLIMMASVFGSRVLGLGREMVLAHIGGTSGAVDAYQIAFVLPEILNHVVASGFLSVTFIPIFSDYLARNDPDEGWRAFEVILSGFGVLLLALMAASWLAAPLLVGWLAPGLNDPATLNAAVSMTRIILPAQFFFFSGGMLMAVQYVHERFLIPALAPLIYNLGIIAGGIWLGPTMGVSGFAWGVLAGAGIGNFALQLYGARKVGMAFRLSWNLRHPALGRFIRLTLPLMLGLTLLFSTEIFFKLFGSFLPAGGIAGLNYALRVVLILVGLSGQALGVASYPFLARLAAEQRLDDMARLLNDTLGYLALVIPAAVLLIVLRQEVVLVLFQRGAFDTASTALTSQVLGWLLIGAYGFAAQTVVVRGFYALKNTLLPAIYTTLAVAASLPLYWLGLRWLGAAGIAMAISLSASLQVMVLYEVWVRRHGAAQGRTAYRPIARMILISLPLGLGLGAGRALLVNYLPLAGIDPGSFPGSLVICLIVGALFMSLILLLGFRLNISPIREVLQRRRSPGSA
ncbi:MAG: murein biosynthesis integral membrane protein MurJ [Desulfobacterales bacterium]